MKILTILLLTIIVISCKSQEPDTLIINWPYQIDSLNREISIRDSIILRREAAIDTLAQHIDNNYFESMGIENVATLERRSDVIVTTIRNESLNSTVEFKNDSSYVEILIRDSDGELFGIGHEWTKKRTYFNIKSVK